MSSKIIYKDVAVGADTDAAVTVTGADVKSNPALLPFGVETTDFATLELNKWGGSGSKKIYTGQDIALVSSAMSGADCMFVTPPSFMVTFDSNYTTLGVFLRFATNSVDYATSITLTWFQGATQLSQKTFHPDGPSYWCENTVTAYNKLVVTINSTNLPGRYARVEQIIFGVVREFTGNEIGSVEILQEVNLISLELSINTLDWSIKGSSGVDYIFQLKQPVEAYNGSKLVGVFYIDDNATQTGEQGYEIPCQDAIGVLDGYPFAAVMYSGKNAVTAINEIVDNVFELDIDASFASVTLTGLNPDGTKRTALQQVAFAIGAVVDTSGTNKIRIYPAPTSSPSVIPMSRAYCGGSIKQDSIVTAVVITYHTYTAGSSGDDVITVGGTKYVHTTGTVRVDNPNVTASDKQNEKPITDCTLVNASNAAAVAARVYAYYQKRNTVDRKIVVDSEEPGDYVTIPVPWSSGGTMTGNIESMKIRLSNTTAADVTIKAVS